MSGEESGAQVAKSVSAKIFMFIMPLILKPIFSSLPMVFALLWAAGSGIWKPKFFVVTIVFLWAYSLIKNAEYKADGNVWTFMILDIIQNPFFFLAVGFKMVPAGSGLLTYITTIVGPMTLYLIIFVLLRQGAKKSQFLNKYCQRQSFSIKESVNIFRLNLKNKE